MSLTFRYNWMGPVGTVTKVEICNSSRLDHGQRTKDMEYRRKVVKKVRDNMLRIKKDLGLAVAESPPRDLPAPPPVTTTPSEPIVMLVAQHEGSPQAAAPVLSSRTAKAAHTVSTAIRSSLIRSGVSYTSFLDGTLHEGLRKVNLYNEFGRPLLAEALKGSGIAIPNEEEFETASLAAAIKEEAVCRIALDAARKQRDLTYMSSFVPPTPSSTHGDSYSNSNKQQTPFDSLPDDEYESLEAVYQELRQRVNGMRNTYNLKAEACARAFLKSSAARCLDLEKRFQAAHPSRSADDDIEQHVV